MSYILTHPGSAHKDDFLACCVLAAELGLPIVRRDPTPEELADPEVWVLDIGGEHEPARHNFDHHQFPPDHPPSCSLSLVLMHLGLYEDAKRFCPWMETAEWIDAQGARQTAKWLGVDPFVVTQLSSPLDFSLLRYFAAETELTPSHPIGALMARIGGDLLDYLRGLRRNLDELKHWVQFWDMGPFQIGFLPRTEDLPPEVADSLSMFIREQDGDIAGMVSPDKRGNGYGLTRITEEEDVHFAHKQGFVAKTSATDPERLRTLVQQAIVPK